MGVAAEKAIAAGREVLEQDKQATDGPTEKRTEERLLQIGEHHVTVGHSQDGRAHVHPPVIPVVTVDPSRARLSPEGALKTVVILELKGEFVIKKVTQPEPPGKGPLEDRQELIPGSWRGTVCRRHG